MTEVDLVLLFMIAASIIAIGLKDLLSSVVALGAVGIGLCMGFLALKAPGLAVTQLVVEILSLIVLIRATSRDDVPFSMSGRWLFNTVSTVVFLSLFIIGAYFAFKDMPPFGYPAMKFSGIYFEEAASSRGNENVVAIVLSKFRSFDMIGEVAVIFTAIVGVLALTRGAGRKEPT
jgi:multisubunit Na+/H+ antiporter MnhB subunit